jgi:hypothetical protein
MKFTGKEIFGIVASLSAANSTKGQGRKFIRINKKRFSTPYDEIIGWAGDYEDDFEGVKVQKSPEGDVQSFQFDPDNGREALEAFSKFLVDTEYEVEPYRMTEEVMDFIDGIDINQEGALMQLTTEAV